MLEPYFHLHREVHDHDEFFDERRVIDLVIEPKFEWHRRYLGVELKRPQRMDSSAIGHWIRQAFNYQRTD